jgi:hypothetical protein
MRGGIKVAMQACASVVDQVVRRGIGLHILSQLLTFDQIAQPPKVRVRNPRMINSIWGAKHTDRRSDAQSKAL